MDEGNAEEKFFSNFSPFNSGIPGLTSQFWKGFQHLFTSPPTQQDTLFPWGLSASALRCQQTPWGRPFPS